MRKVLPRSRPAASRARDRHAAAGELRLEHEAAIAISSSPNGKNTLPIAASVIV
jgi:hypothetical protein